MLHYRDVLIALLAILVVLCTVVSTPVPAISVGSQNPTDTFAPPSTDVDFTLTFDNSGGTSFGYGPVVDAIIPSGMTVKSIKVYGQDTVYTLTQGSAHPLLDGVTIDKLSNETLVTIELPFLSYAHDLPSTPVTVTLTTAPTFTSPAVIKARGVFWRGTDTSDNQGSDPPIYDTHSITQSASWTTVATYAPPPTQPVDPAVLAVRCSGLSVVAVKGVSSQFTVALNLPENRTYTGAVITIPLPDKITYISYSVAPASVSVQSDITPIAGVPHATINNTITLQLASPIIGGPALNDVIVTVDIQVPERDAFGNLVLPPSGTVSVGLPQTATLDVIESSTMGAFAPRARSVSDTRAFSLAHDSDFALSWAISNNVGATTCLCCARADICAPGPRWTPGDTLTYTAQVNLFSNYYAYGNIIVVNTLTDGQRLSTVQQPRLRYQLNGGTTNTVSFVPGDSYTETHDIGNDSNPATLGRTKVVFNVTRQLELAGVSHGGRANGVGSWSIEMDALTQDLYSDYPRSNGAVYQGESVSCQSTLTGIRLLDPGTGAFLGPRSSQTESQSPESDKGVLVSQELYAVDGIVCPGGSCLDPELVPNSQITYRLRYDMPFTSLARLMFTFFLPYPILDISSMTPFSNVISATPPALHGIQYGPEDTFNSVAGMHPTRIVTASSNRLDIYYPSAVNDVLNRQSRVDLLFTMDVSTVAGFPDGASLLIIGTTTEGNMGSLNGAFSSSSSQIVLRLREPVLEHWTTALRLEKSAGSITPPTGLNGILDTTGACASPYTAADFLSSAVLESTYPVGHVEEIDAGDIITFATIVRNTGGASAFKVRLNLQTPSPDYQAVDYVTGQTLCVFNGRRQALAFTNPTATSYQLTDISSVIGALSGKDDGTNVVVILHKAQATNSLVITTTASKQLVDLEAYYGGPSATDNHVLSLKRREVTMKTQLPQLVHFAITTTSLTDTQAGYYVTAYPDLARGESVTVKARVRLPDGITHGVRMAIQSTGRLEYISHTLGVGSNIVNTPAVTTSSTLVDVVRGTVTNPSDDTIDSKDEFNLTATFVNSHTGINNAGQVHALIATQEDYAQSGQRRWELYFDTVAPVVCYNLVPNSVMNMDAGDSRFFTLLIYHCSTSTSVAFDVAIDVPFASTDPFDFKPGSGSLSHSAGPPFASPLPTTSFLNGVIRVNIPRLLLGQVLALSYEGVARQSNTPGDTYTHRASTKWYSVPVLPTPPASFVESTSDLQYAFNIFPNSPVSFAMEDTSLAATTNGQYTGATDMAIGERGTLRFAFQWAEGDNRDHQMFAMYLPAHPTIRLDIVGYRVKAFGASLSSQMSPPVLSSVSIDADALHDVVFFTFGALNNTADNIVGLDDRVVVDVDVIVPTYAGLGNGNVLSVTTQYIVNAVSVKANVGLAVEIVEPNVAISLTSNATTGDAGDVFLFTVRLNHLPGSTSSVYNSTMVIPIADTLIIECTTLLASPGSAVLVFDQHACQTSKTVRVTAEEVPLSSFAEFTYLVRMNSTVAPAVRVRNKVSYTGTSSPSVPTRTYTSEAEVEIVTASPSTIVTITAHTVSQTLSSHFEPTSMDLAVGERVTIQIDHTLPEGTMFIETNITLPLLPGKLKVVNATVTHVGSSITGSLLSPGDGPSRFNGTQNVFFDFGTVTNQPNGVENEQDHLILQVIGEVVDEPMNTQGVNMEVKVTTFFQLGDLVCYDTKWNGGTSSQVLTPVMIPGQTAVDFYSYGNPRGSSANTGMEQENTILMYFVVDNTNNTAFVLVHDKSPNPSGGEVYTTIQSDSLAGLDVELLLMDDAHGAQDQYSWDKNTGTGSFHHVWATCCTDGMVLGYFPQTEYCFRPSFNIIRGIDKVSLMVQDANMQLQYTYIPLNELNGLEVCGHTCNAQTRTLSSYSNIIKFDIVEPKVTISMFASTSVTDAGNIVLFTYVITHAGSCPNSCAPVFDMRITIDPTFWTWIPGSFNPGPTPVDIKNAGQPTNSTIDHNIAELEEGQTIIVSFSGVINQDVVAGQAYSVLANLVYDSHQGSRGRSGTAQGSVGLTMDKLVIEDATSIIPAEGASVRQFHDAGVLDLPIGQPFTLSLPLTLMEGQDILTIRLDAMNPGMELVWGKLYRYGAQVNAVPSVGTAMSTQDLKYSDSHSDRLELILGATSNIYDNVKDDDDQIELRFAVRLHDVASNFDGVRLILRTTATYANGVVSKDTAIDVVQPVITLTKSANTTVVDAGDIVAYKVTGSHHSSSTATAYNITLDDALNSVSLGALLPSSIRCSVSCQVSTPNQQAVRVEITMFEHTAVPFTLHYAVQVNRFVIIPAVVRNDVLGNYRTWNDMFGRALQTGVTTHNINTDTATQGLVISTTSLAETGFTPTSADATVGERVTLKSVATIPEGNVTDLQFTITVPGSVTTALMTIEEIEVVSISSRITVQHNPPVITRVWTGASPAPWPSGTPHRSATVSFGKVFNDYNNLGDDTVAITATLRLLDHPWSVAPRTINIQSLLTAGTTSLSNSVGVNVLEGILLSSIVSNASLGDAGDTVQYTVTLKHSGASTAAVYNTTVLLSLPNTLSLSPATITTTHGAVDMGAASNTVKVFIPLYLRVAASDIDITFISTLTTHVVPDDLLTVTSETDWFTSDRDGRQLTHQASNAQVRIAHPRLVTISSFNSTVSSTDTSEHRSDVMDVAVGEMVTIALTVYLTEGTTNCTVHMSMPPGPVLFEPTGKAWVTLGSNLALVDVGGPDSVETKFFDTNSDGYTDSVSAFPLRIVNQPDNTGNTTADALTLYVQGRVTTAPVNTDSAAFEIVGRVNYGSGLLTATLPGEVVEPGIAVQLSSNVTEVDAGDIVLYTADVYNPHVQTGPLFNVTVYLRPQARSSSLLTRQEFVSCIPSCSVLSLTADAIIVRLPQLTPGQKAHVSTPARIDESVGYFQRTVDVNVIAEGYSHAVTPSRLYRVNNDTSITVRFRSQYLGVQVFNTSAPWTSTGQFDAAVEDLVVGEEVVIQARVHMQEGTSPVRFFVSPPSHDYISILGYSFDHSHLVAVSQAPVVTKLGIYSLIDFPSITNYGNNVNDTQDDLLFNVRCRIRDHASVTNGLQFEMIVGIIDHITSIAKRSAIDIVEPQMIISTTANITHAIADQVRSLHPLVNGSAILRTTTITHGATSRADAKALLVSERMGDTVLVPGSVQSSEGTVTSGNGPTDRDVEIWIDTLALTDPTVTITYLVYPSLSHPLGSNMTSRVDLAYSSLPSTLSQFARNYSATASNSVWLLRPGPNILSVVFDDPDDLDRSTLSTNDTATIHWSEDTNTPPVATTLQILSQLRFSVELGPQLSGVWQDARTLVITVIQPSTTVSEAQLLSSFTVKAIGSLKDVHEQTSTSRSISLVATGDVGRLGPQITSMVADDPDDLDAIYSGNDTVTLSFSEATNTPHVTSNQEVKQLLAFPAGNLGSQISGKWLDSRTLQLTVMEAVTGTPPTIATFSIKVIGPLMDASNFTLPSRAQSPVLQGDWGLRPGPGITALLADDPDDGDRVVSNGDRLYVGFDRETNRPVLNTTQMIERLFSFNRVVARNYSGVWIDSAQYPTYLQSTNPRTRDALMITLEEITSTTLSPQVMGQLHVTLKREGPYQGLQDKGQTTFASTGSSPALVGDWGRQGPVIISFTADDPDDGDLEFSVGDTMTVVFDIDTNTPSLGKNRVDVSAVVTLSVGGLDVSGKWSSPNTMLLTVLSAAPVASIGTLTITATSAAINNQYGNATANTISSATLQGDWGQRHGPYITSALASDPDNKDGIYSVGDTIKLNFSEPTDQSGVVSSTDVFKIFRFSQNMGSFITGVWLNSHTITLTVLDITGSNEPRIGSTMVSVHPGHIRDQAQTTAYASQHGYIDVTLTGDWGVITGPVITAVTARDLDNGDAVFGPGDEIVISFSMATNQVPATSKQDLDSVFAWSMSIGQNYTGRWVDPSTLVVTIVNATSTSPTPKPFWNKDGTFVPGQLRVTVLPSSSLRAADLRSLPSTAPSPAIAGDWGQKSGPALTLVEIADPDNADATFGQGDVIQLTFDSATNVPNIANKTMIDRFIFFQTNASVPMLQLSSASATAHASHVALSLGAEYTGAWTTDRSLTIVITNATGASNIPQNPNDLIVRLKGYIQDPTETSLPCDSISTDIKDAKLSGGNWGLLPGPQIISLVAQDPDNLDDRYSNGDTLSITFGQEPNTRPSLNSTRKVDSVFTFNRRLGTHYTGAWVSNVTCTITVLNVTGHGSPDIGVLMVTVQEGAGLKNLAGISLSSTSTSPLLTGNWGTLAANQGPDAVGAGAGGVAQLGGKCRTFWCRYSWLLVFGLACTIFGILLIGHFTRLKRIEMKRQLEIAHLAAMKEALRQQMTKPKKKKSALPAIAALTTPTQPKRSKLPSLLHKPKVTALPMFVDDTGTTPSHYGPQTRVKLGPVKGKPVLGKIPAQVSASPSSLIQDLPALASSNKKLAPISQHPPVQDLAKIEKDDSGALVISAHENGTGIPFKASACGIGTVLKPLGAAPILGRPNATELSKSSSVHDSDRSNPVTSSIAGGQHSGPVPVLASREIVSSPASNQGLTLKSKAVHEHQMNLYGAVMTSGGSRSGASGEQQHPNCNEGPGQQSVVSNDDDDGLNECDTPPGARGMAKPVHSTGRAEDVHREDILSFEEKPAATQPAPSAQVAPAAVTSTASVESLEGDLPELDDYYLQHQEAAIKNEQGPNPVPVTPPVFSTGPSRPRVINMRAQSSSDEERKEKEYQLSRLEGGMGHLPGALHDDIRVVTERRTRGGSKTPQSGEKSKSSRGKKGRSRGHHKPLPSNPTVAAEGTPPVHDGDDVSDVESPVVSATGQVPSTMPVIPTEPITLASAAVSAAPVPATPDSTSAAVPQRAPGSPGGEGHSETPVTASPPLETPVEGAAPAIPRGHIIDLRKRAKELKRQARMEMKKRSKGKSRGHHKPLPSPVEPDSITPTPPVLAASTPASAALVMVTAERADGQSVESSGSPDPIFSGIVSKKASKKNRRKDGKSLPSLPPVNVEVNDSGSPLPLASPSTPRPRTPQEEGGAAPTIPAIPELPPPALPPSSTVPAMDLSVVHSTPPPVVPVTASPMSTGKKKPLPPPPSESESDGSMPHPPARVSSNPTPQSARKRLPTPPTSSSEGEM